MRRAISRTIVVLIIFLALLWPPQAGRAAGDPGVSVAPQAGVPGTKFEVLGAGWPPNGVVTVLVERGAVAGRPVEATIDANGRFRWTLDSNGYAEGTNYKVTVAGKGNAVPPAVTTFAVTSRQGERCFIAETGFCTRGRFLDYWVRHGGLAVMGYPISAEFGEVLEDGRPYVVQYFERTRLEYHPESADQAYQVLLGHFGRRVRPADPPADPNPMQTWFPQTGHNVPTDFYAYWTATGGLAQFGLPISEAFQQQLEDGKSYRVQYFERARFEAHPENAAPYELLLGQFGRMILPQAQR